VHGSEEPKQRLPARPLVADDLDDERVVGE
jgi:hypothetical protein